MARTIAKDFDVKSKLILKTAAKVFAAEGVDRASMSQVAQACNISKANIYHYYDSKNALLFAILDTHLRELRDRICSVASDHSTPAEHFHAVLLEILLAYQGADNEHRVQATGIPDLPREQQDILLGYQRDLVRHLSDVINTVAPKAFVTDSSKLHAVTMSVFGMLNWFYMWNRHADTQARENYARLVADLSLKGIGGV